MKFKEFLEISSCFDEVSIITEAETIILEQGENFVHRATKGFLDLFNKLPSAVRVDAQEKFKIMRSNPSDPSVNLKPWQSGNGVWQVYVNYRYRALSSRTANSKGDVVYIWFWIGTRETLNHFEKHVGRRVTVPNLDKIKNNPKPAEIR